MKQKKDKDPKLSSLLLTTFREKPIELSLRKKVFDEWMMANFYWSDLRCLNLLQ